MGKNKSAESIFCDVSAEDSISSLYQLVAGQELEQTHVVDTFLIAIGHNVIFYNYNLLERVVYPAEGFQFLFTFHL